MDQPQTVIFKLELDVNHVNTIMHALGKLPAEVTRGTMNYVEIQTTRQLKALQGKTSTPPGGSAPKDPAPETGDGQKEPIPGKKNKKK